MPVPELKIGVRYAVPDETTGLCIQQVEVRVSQIEVSNEMNPRTNLGTEADLKKLGQSVDREGQISPLICIPTGRKKDPVSLRDGFRRVTAAKKGYTTRKVWRAEIVMDVSGKAPPEEVVRRYVTVANIARKNYSPVDKARYCEEVITAAMRVAQAEYEAECEEKGIIPEAMPRNRANKARAQAVRELADTFGERARNIDLYLDTLKHHPTIRKEIHEGRLPMFAARLLLKLPEDEALAALERAKELHTQTLKEAAQPEDDDGTPLDEREIKVPGESVFLPPKSSESGKSGSRRSAPTHDIPEPTSVRHSEVEEAIRLTQGKKKGAAKTKSQKKSGIRTMPEIVALIGDLESTRDDSQVNMEVTDLAIAIAGLLRWLVHERDAIPALIPVELTGRLADTPRG